MAKKTKRQYRLLIVDDSKSILKILQKAFSSTPYDVTTCENPVLAYEMVENEHFDILISDIIMPEMNGLELLKKIKKFNGTIQVIMYTGEITVHNAINAFRYGANDIFFKPLKDMKKMITAVDTAAKKINRMVEILDELAMLKRKYNGV